MARRQIYDDVMDVALRNTLKECGFTRKTRRDYILERPDRIWIFELEMVPNRGFEATAAIFLTEMDAIIKRYAPDFWVHLVGTRNPAHLCATIPQLMQIAAGHDYYTIRRGPASRNWSEAYQRAQGDPVMKYRDLYCWVLPKYGERLGRSQEERIRDLKRGARELGLFMDEQWRFHAWKWYWNCENYGFVVDWMENHQIVSPAAEMSLGVLCYLAGDYGKARRYFRSHIDASKRPYDDVYRELHAARRGSWLRRIWGKPGNWTEQEVVEETKKALEYNAMLADAARRVAGGLGITLDD